MLDDNLWIVVVVGTNILQLYGWVVANMRSVGEVAWSMSPRDQLLALFF